MVENLQDIRASIDMIDDQLLDLICRRMDLSKAVATAKSGTLQQYFVDTT